MMEYEDGVGSGAEAALRAFCTGGMNAVVGMADAVSRLYDCEN